MVELETKVFGKVAIEDDKVIIFDHGILGFPDLKRFALIHDIERGEDAGIRYLQSLDEPGFAMPVMDPTIVKPDYNPHVSEELLEPVGDITKEEILLFVTVTVPHDITKMTVNLMAPIVVNVQRKKACQIIAEEDGYSIKYAIYDILKAMQDVGQDNKKKAGE